MVKIRLAGDLTINSIVDGTGLRTVIWTQGCIHNCKGCHNPVTHNLKGGYLKDCDELIEEILSNKPNGVTFSGGDPFEQAEVCAYIAKRLKEHNINLWAYTGYTFEEVEIAIGTYKFLRQLDVLVDSKFKIDERDTTIPFRGSRNQRIIDVPSSLRLNKVCEIERYKL